MERKFYVEISQEEWIKLNKILDIKNELVNDLIARKLILYILDNEYLLQEREA